MILMATIWIGTALLVIAALVIFSIFILHSHTKDTLTTCNQLTKEFEKIEEDQKAIKKTLILQMNISKEYYKNVLFRASLSFTFALIFAGMGILLFFSIIIFMVFGLSNNITTTVVSVVAGALVQALSGINFYLYDHASKQIETFHPRLDRLQNYMLATTICQGLAEPVKTHTCSRLSLIIASSSVSANEGQVIGDIMKQSAILSTEQPALAQNEHTAPKALEVS